MTNIDSIDEYIAAQPEHARGALNLVRGAIRKGLPKAEETISYKMPTYRIGDRRLIQFAGWKRHYALYAATAGVMQAFKYELEPYEVIKGTIRFPLDKPVPVKLIEKIARFRAGEAAERARS
jgi:uncharacterized protein YdhG (YjbR/CyaY superfamily)